MLRASKIRPLLHDEEKLYSNKDDIIKLIRYNSVLVSYTIVIRRVSTIT